MMKQRLVIMVTFAFGAAYDGVLGVVFLLMAPQMFAMFGVTPPNHYGYVHFAAAVLIVFAWMFKSIAQYPYRNRNLIPYGILLKVAYCGVVGYHWITAGVPTMWKPFVICDLVFLALFYWAYIVLGKQEAPKKT